MALIAQTETWEIVFLLIGIYLFDGGIIRKFGAIGLFVLGLQLSYLKQSYVSDLTTQPTNVGLFYIPSLQQDIVIMFALLVLVTFAFMVVDIGKILKFKKKNGVYPEDLWEYLT